MRVLLLAPQYDAGVPGESWSTYKWIQGISAYCETVVLTQHWPGWDCRQSPTAAQLVVNWDEPRIPGLNRRITWELKPTYPLFYRRARKWIIQAQRRGEVFDLVHQINPLALRYPCPARGLGLKYLVGPLAGSLPTPPTFNDGLAMSQWYRVLRRFDSIRLRHDPWLKDSYALAAAVIGVAPYVRELLSHCVPKRFEIMAETGVEEVFTKPKPAFQKGRPLRLLFVGRLIRTKGILEAIESVAQASRHCPVILDVVGSGILMGECLRLARKLDAIQHINFHGWLPRSEVFTWYDRSDAFLFPSYREPSGNVVFEAMSRGLPVITSTIGGPGYMVTAECGLCVPPQSRASYVAGLHTAIISLAQNPDLLASLSAGALRRVTETALWPAKIERMLTLYRDILKNAAENTSVQTGALL